MLLSYYLEVTTYSTGNVMLPEVRLSKGEADGYA
jgi:hypothetical protein